MNVAMLSPISRHTPPRSCGPVERMVRLLTEDLVRRGTDVTLFACCNIPTTAKLRTVMAPGYEEELTAPVRECLHISDVFEQGEAFDLIHNHFGYLPLTYLHMTRTPVLTTIHGRPSPSTLPVYLKYNRCSYYVAPWAALKSPELDYIATVPYGIDTSLFPFRPEPGEYLLCLGSIHSASGTRNCIRVAHEARRKLVLAGPIQDADYFKLEIEPLLDESRLIYFRNPDTDRKKELLAGAYALIQGYHRDDLSGTSAMEAMEAMACGTPVLSMKQVGMAEVIADGKTGILASDVLEMARAVPRMAGMNRRECRRWVEERFRMDCMVEEYLRVYGQICAERQREDHRPWGFYQVLSARSDHKVKRITVFPGQRLSIQRHLRRSEHWYVIQGEATVMKDGAEIRMTAGHAVDLPATTWHRITNQGSGNLIFIEVQTGDYFGEDDIERCEDDYGRAG